MGVILTGRVFTPLAFSPLAAPARGQAARGPNSPEDIARGADLALVIGRGTPETPDQIGSQVQARREEVRCRSVSSMPQTFISIPRCVRSPCATPSLRR
ncbi:MAG: hypothetical protein B7Y61_06335 [Rhizobiales bacterium 35-66-30]|nr:MAG: hypothetical protein B7Y61_06335 [Rhizobiales bacterium 35-66-30]OZB04109.1 MAG: hypothetical protein B7X67_15155 [Rhizobiales bacterium 39-66-18]